MMPSLLLLFPNFSLNNIFNCFYGALLLLINILPQKCFLVKLHRFLCSICPNNLFAFVHMKHTLHILKSCCNILIIEWESPAYLFSSLGLVRHHWNGHFRFVALEIIAQSLFQHTYCFCKYMLSFFVEDFFLCVANPSWGECIGSCIFHGMHP